MRTKTDIIGDTYLGDEDESHYSFREVVNNLAILVEVLADIRNILDEKKGVKWL
jgi:cephalosporin-C deacetylase-like acetyl esterase